MSAFGQRDRANAPGGDGSGAVAFADQWGERLTPSGPAKRSGTERGHDVTYAQRDLHKRVMLILD